MLISYRFAYRCGSADDPAGKAGLAALTARLMARGASRSQSYKQILDAMFEMACAFDVQVDQELTVFSGVVHVDHQARFEQMVRAMMEQPAFLPEDFARVREELVNAIRVELCGSNDEELAKEALYCEIYRDHPYGHPSIGKSRELEAITIDEVTAFHALLLRRTGRITLPEPRALDGIEVLLIEKPDARGVAMSFGHPIPVTRGHADYPALLVAQCWLGQHRNGGRLFDSIREVRGLNYGDYAYLEYFPRGMFQFEPDPCLARQQQIFQVWLRPVAPDRALFALKLALYEIDALRRDGISVEDFERTRRFLGKYTKLLLKTDLIRQGYAIDSEFYGTGEYSRYVEEGLKALTVEQVNAAARKYFSTERLCVVAVGPNMGKFLPGDVTPISYEVPQPEAVLAVDRIAAAWPFEPARVRTVGFEEMF